MTAHDDKFPGYDVVQSTPYSCYVFGLSVSLINFVWPWKSKQRHLACLFPSDLFLRVFYFSILQLSLNSANLFSFSQVKRSSCLNPPCLFFEPCLLLLCSSLSLDINVFHNTSCSALSLQPSTGPTLLVWQSCKMICGKSNSKIFHKKSTWNLSTQYLHNRNAMGSNYVTTQDAQHYTRHTFD